MIAGRAPSRRWRASTPRKLRTVSPAPSLSATASTARTCSSRLTTGLARSRPRLSLSRIICCNEREIGARPARAHRAPEQGRIGRWRSGWPPPMPWCWLAIFASSTRCANGLLGLGTFMCPSSARRRANNTGPHTRQAERPKAFARRFAASPRPDSRAASPGGPRWCERPAVPVMTLRSPPGRSVRQAFSSDVGSWVDRRGAPRPGIAADRTGCCPGTGAGARGPAREPPEKVRALLFAYGRPRGSAPGSRGSERGRAGPAEAAPAAMPVADMTAPVLIVRQHILASLGGPADRRGRNTASRARCSTAGDGRPRAVGQAALPILVFVGLGLALRARLLAHDRRLSPAAHRDAAGHRRGAAGRGRPAARVRPGMGRLVRAGLARHRS